MFDMSSAIVSAASIGLTVRHSGQMQKNIWLLTGLSLNRNSERPIENVIWSLSERALNHHYIIVLYPFPVFCQIIY